MGFFLSFAHMGMQTNQHTDISELRIFLFWVSYTIKCLISEFFKNKKRNLYRCSRVLKDILVMMT